MPKQYDTSQYIQRPSEKERRTYIQKAQTNLTASTDIYTVSAGKTLYITNLLISVINSSTTAGGRVELRDGDDSGELIDSIILPIAILGTLSPYEKTSSTLVSEPYRFYTNVRLVEALGTLTFSISFNGYEE